MKDNIEKFIHQHRAEFDVDGPPKGFDAVWSQVDKAVNGKGGKRISLRRIMGIAASVLLLLAAGTFFGIQLEKQYQQKTGNLVKLPAEIEEMEGYYEVRVKRQLAKLSGSGYKETVKEDLQELEMFMLALKEELLNTPDAGRDDVVAAMIDNYKARLAILEKVLMKLENEPSNQNTTNKTEDESIDI